MDYSRVKTQKEASLDKDNNAKKQARSEKSQTNHKCKKGFKMDNSKKANTKKQESPFTLPKDTRRLFDFQAGAEIVSVSVSVEEVGQGSIDLGLKEDADFFLNNIDLAQKATKSTQNVRAGSKVFTHI